MAVDLAIWVWSLAGVVLNRGFFAWRKPRAERPAGAT
jgi:hypothetical protein